MLSIQFDIPPNRLSKLPITISTDVLKKSSAEMHIHNFTQICYVQAGDINHYIEDSKYMQKPGSCITVLPYHAHRIDNSASDITPVQIFISFPDRFLTERGYSYFSYSHKFANFEGMNIPEHVFFKSEEKELADSLIKKLSNEFFKHKKMSYDVIAETLAAFLRLLCKCGSNQSKTIKIPKSISERANSINSAVKYITEHYAEKITIDDLSKFAIMARHSFFRNFKEITGMTPSRMINLLRLRNATLLLIHTNKTLDEISQEVGLYDKSYLTNLFKKEARISPGKYRDLNMPKPFLEEYHKRRWRWIEDPNYDEQENTQ